MTSKEALDKLFMACDSDLLYEQSGILFATELTKPIEKDLERLEVLEKENEDLQRRLNRSLPKIVIRNTLDNVLPSLEEENEKLKKAIEILKEKPEILMIRLEAFYQCDNGKNYVAEYFEYDAEGDEIRTLIFITKEQYELLKEVRGND